MLAPQPFVIDRGTPIDVDILVRALSEAGHLVDLVCYPEGEDRSYPGVTVHRAPAPEPLHGTPPGFSWRKVLKDLWMVPVILGLLRRNHYDVVHAGEESVFLAMIMKTLFGVPYVYDMDSSIPQQMVEQKPALRPLFGAMNAAERAAIRGSLAVAPVCPALADLARSRGAGHVIVLHDISELKEPGRAPTGFLRAELGISDPILMYVGNLQPYQGVDLLLDAVARTLEAGTGVELIVAGGSGEKIREYRQRADGLGILDRTHFIGPWPNERLGELLAEADILTTPRIRGINTPMKVFPYLHSGKPVLVTDLGTHNQILDSSVAMLAPPDPEGFSGAIVRLVEDVELRAKLGRNGRFFVERKHTYPAHRARVFRLYDFVAHAVRQGARELPERELVAR